MRFFGTSFEQICPWLRHGLAAPAKFHRCLVFLPSTVREIIESHTNTNEGNSRDQMGETPANFCRNRPSASRPPWRRAAPQLAPPGRPAWPAGAPSRPPPPPGWWWERNGVLCGRRRGLYAGEVRRESSRGADDVESTVGWFRAMAAGQPRTRGAENKTQRAACNPSQPFEC